MKFFKKVKFNTKVNYIKFFQRLSMEEYLHYVGGGAYLPPPLDSDEEERCVKTILEESSRQKLIEHNLRLVVYIAKKFENTNICIDDLISIGTIGLIKAVNTFNTDKKIKLATYYIRQ